MPHIDQLGAHWSIEQRNFHAWIVAWKRPVMARQGIKTALEAP